MYLKLYVIKYDNQIQIQIQIHQISVFKYKHVFEPIPGHHHHTTSTIPISTLAT